MWNEKRSILLSKIAVGVFAAALLLLDIEGYFIARLFARLRNMTQTDVMLFCLTLYVFSIPAWLTLYRLFALLKRIGRGEVFSRGNVASLRVIGWCCFLGAAVCALSAIYYLPFLVVAAAGAFMGLIVRIVKNCFEQAVCMQGELDYTV